MGAPAGDTSAENMARRGGMYWLVTRLREAYAGDASAREASASDVIAGNASVRRGISWIFVI